MKNSKKIIFKISVLSILFFSLLIACTQKEKQKVYNEIASDVDCLAEPSWFPHEQTAAPKEGGNSPFNDGKMVTNLDFYRWSWQKFLWLTKPTIVTKTINFIENGVSKPLRINDTLPLFLVEDKIIPIDDAMAPLERRGVANVMLIYNKQACSNEVLKTNPNYGEVKKSEAILYSLHTSPTMLKAANEFIQKMKAGKLDSVKNYETFPVGSLELKVSWVVTSALPKKELSKYYTTIGAVSNDDGITFTNVEVAMLGMHVVGVVENHPEFIWATFQHNDLTTSYDWSKNEATSTTEKLLFKKGSTTGIGGIIYPSDSTVHPTPYEAYELFQYGVPLNKNGSYMQTSQTEPKNINNIKDINTCVSKHLKDEFQNYFCNGAVWLDTENYPTIKKQGELIVDLKYEISSAVPVGGTNLGLLRGSTNCANATMETFTQSFQSSLTDVKVNTIANCFSCHSAPSFKNRKIESPLYLSHIFDAAVQRSNGSTDIQIEAMKNKEALMHVVKSNRMKN